MIFEKFRKNLCGTGRVFKNLKKNLCGVIKEFWRTTWGYRGFDFFPTVKNISRWLWPSEKCHRIDNKEILKQSDMIKTRLYDTVYKHLIVAIALKDFKRILESLICLCVSYYLCHFPTSLFLSYLSFSLFHSLIFVTNQISKLANY